MVDLHSLDVEGKFAIGNDFEVFFCRKPFNLFFLFLLSVMFQYYLRAKETIQCLITSKLRGPRQT